MAGMADRVDQRIAAGRSARAELQPLSETIHRLQRQMDGLYAETRHWDKKVAHGYDQLDRLERRTGSWLGSLFGRGQEQQLDDLRAELYEAEDRYADARRRFEETRTELDEARDRHDDLQLVADDYAAALDDKESGLLTAGDDTADRLRVIATELEDLAVRLGETDDLLTSVGWSDRALDTLGFLVGRAMPAAAGDLAGGGILAGKAKFDELQAVDSAAAYADRCLSKLSEELRTYGERRPLRSGQPLDAGARLLDVWLDRPGLDVKAFVLVLQARKQIPRTRDVVRQVADDLAVRRTEILAETEALTTERTALLSG